MGMILQYFLKGKLRWFGCAGICLLVSSLIEVSQLYFKLGMFEFDDMSLFRPKKQKREHQNHLVEAIEQSATIENTDLGFEAEIADLDLSFLDLVQYA